MTNDEWIVHKLRNAVDVPKSMTAFFDMSINGKYFEVQKSPLNDVPIKLKSFCKYIT